MENLNKLLPKKLPKQPTTEVKNSRTSVEESNGSQPRSASGAHGSSSSNPKKSRTPSQSSKKSKRSTHRVVRSDTINTTTPGKKVQKKNQVVPATKKKAGEIDVPEEEGFFARAMNWVSTNVRWYHILGVVLFIILAWIVFRCLYYSNGVYEAFGFGYALYYNFPILSRIACWMSGDHEEVIKTNLQHFLSGQGSNQPAQVAPAPGQHPSGANLPLTPVGGRKTDIDPKESNSVIEYFLDKIQKTLTINGHVRYAQTIAPPQPSVPQPPQTPVSETQPTYVPVQPLNSAQTSEQENPVIHPAVDLPPPSSPSPKTPHNDGILVLD
jgi:hypothetical protein